MIVIRVFPYEIHPAGGVKKPGFGDIISLKKECNYVRCVEFDILKKPVPRELSSFPSVEFAMPNSLCNYPCFKLACVAERRICGISLAQPCNSCYGDGEIAGSSGIAKGPIALWVPSSSSFGM